MLCLEKHVNRAVEHVHNRLLATLPAADLAALRPLLEWVDLEARQVLEVPGRPIKDAYFIERGLVSVVGTAEPDHRIGDDRSANETLVQSAGSALRISAANLRQAMLEIPPLTALLLRYAHVFLLQGHQTALANGRGKLDERLARWLLMWHDRLGSDELVITHEFLALLLGVRRQGVTEALHALEGLGLIRASRSLIRIVDRGGLHITANGFYGVPEAEYERSIGVLPRPAP